MHYKILNISRRITMNRYKGYLTGINPNYTRKVLQEEDPRYFAYESTTGTFVNGKDQEVKTMKEAVAANDKIDAEYKAAFPPQKSIGAKPVRYSRVRNVTPAEAKPKIKPVEFSFNTAWGPPMNVIKKLKEMFPKLNVHGAYVGEGYEFAGTFDD